MQNLTSTPLPPGVSALLQLFEGPLADVRFPDVDGASLLLLAEETSAATDALSAARASLAQAQSSLIAAETALLTSESALVVKAQRALGYARVYAEGDAELARSLAAVELTNTRPGSPSKGREHPRPSRQEGSLALEVTATPVKRRGRPRKLLAELSGDPCVEISRAPLFVLPPHDQARAHEDVANEVHASAGAV